jgi:hypothetical protein
LDSSEIVKQSAELREDAHALAQRFEQLDAEREQEAYENAVFRGPYILMRDVRGELRFIPAKKSGDGTWFPLSDEEIAELRKNPTDRFDMIDTGQY